MHKKIEIFQFAYKSLEPVEVLYKSSAVFVQIAMLLQENASAQLHIFHKRKEKCIERQKNLKLIML